MPYYSEFEERRRAEERQKEEDRKRNYETSRQILHRHRDYFTAERERSEARLLEAAQQRRREEAAKREAEVADAEGVVVMLLLIIPISIGLCLGSKLDLTMHQAIAAILVVAVILMGVAAPLRPKDVQKLPYLALCLGAIAVLALPIALGWWLAIASK